MASLLKSSYSIPTGNQKAAYTIPKINTKASSYSVPTGTNSAEYYSDGTEALKVRMQAAARPQEAPELEPEKIRKAKEDYRNNTRRKVEEKVREKNKAAGEFSFRQIFSVLLSVVTLVTLLAVFLSSVFALNQAELKTVNLKSSYQTLSAENILTKSRIENNIDYASVYTYATETLGMQLPEKYQVITYEKTGTEYVNKDVDIPNE